MQTSIKRVLAYNVVLICIEVIIMMLIKLNIIISNYGFEVRFNLLFYASIIGLQALIAYLTTRVKYDQNQKNLLIAQLIINPILFLLILSELNVF